jgi:Pyridine nucleotide-disulphide oxidoreductase
MTATAKPTVIVGAGPYGLSVAAHLQARGVPVRIFGDIMNSWRNRMPAGMCLKSTPWASSISAPGPGHTLADFQSEARIPRLRDDEVVPVEQFIRYGEWFAAQLDPQVETTLVDRIDQAGDGFSVTAGTGEQIRASSVVIANGLAGFARLPAELKAVMPDGPSPAGLVSHSSQHHLLAGFAGRRVAVIGAGQSALEGAALMHEAGAEVQLVARSPVRFGRPPADPDRQSSRLLPAPRTPLGPSWALYPFSYAPGAFRYLPERTRRRLVRIVLGPLGAWWLQDRVIGQFPIHAGYHIEAAHRSGETAVLQLAAADGHRFQLRADHIMAATGYRPQVSAIGFLSPGLRARLASRSGSPRLSARFESEVPGIYVVSLAAAATFGPLMRFVAGTSFAARRVSGAIALRGPR